MDLIITQGSFVFEREGKLRDTYQIGNKIGEGSYSSVRRIKHRQTNEKRAVKTIHKKYISNELERQAVMTEVSLLKSVDHPNIIRLHEFYQDEKNYYIITEYCSGGELFERVIRLRSLSENQAATYMQQIFSVLVYLHDRNIVHRDLKPENLMMSSNGHDARLKLIDFGSAYVSPKGSFMTEEVGTAYYMAPEVLKHQYNEKCDLWGAGVILYILLCGFPPFSGNSDREILQKVSIGRVSFPSPEWDSVSFEAKDLIQQLLTQNVSHRPSAREALCHTWLSNASRLILDSQYASPLLTNLQNFRSHQKLKKAILGFISAQLTTTLEREELTNLFKSLDVDLNGSLSKRELKRGFVKVFGDQIEDVDGEIEGIMKNVDLNKSGEIDYSEFISAVIDRQQLLSRQRLDLAFESFDLDRSGTIDAHELKAVLGRYHRYDDGFWIELIQECDLNGDGVIDISEFTRMMLNSL
jgi:calcium-dependent protein kinase